MFDNILMLKYLELALKSKPNHTPGSDEEHISGTH